MNHYEPNVKYAQYPEDFLDHVYLGRCLKPDPVCSGPEGEITDFNMWRRALTEKEMADWTSCK